MSGLFFFTSNIGETNPKKETSLFLAHPGNKTKRSTKEMEDIGTGYLTFRKRETQVETGQ